MSKEFKRKWLAGRISANKGRLGGLGSYQSSKFKSVVLTIDGQKVELNNEEYEKYVKQIKNDNINESTKETSKPKFDPMTGEPL